MLDFDVKTYRRILEIAIEYNIIANCREYPSLLLVGRKTNLKKIRNVLKQNFSDTNLKCGLYIHFPFCESRCSFCKYYSELKVNEKQLDDFLDSFKKEIRMYNMNFKIRKMENLFLGGGTPTLLDCSRMENFLTIIDDTFNFKQDAQRTIEGTPESLTLGKIRLYKRFKINRISIGLQSSNNSVLEKIGRRHTVKDVFAAFDLVRKGGIEYIGTELIWGLPGETMATYKKTVKDLISLSPDFIEGYLFTEGGRAKIKRSYPIDTDINSAIKMSKEMLLSNNYRIYYSSNFLGFIKNGVKRVNAMNQNTDGLYSYYSDVLGIGPGANTHFSGYKYHIVSDFAGYSGSLDRGCFPLLHGVDINRDDYKRHYVILQIGFYRFINKQRYKEIFGTEFYEDFIEEVTYLSGKGIIYEEGDVYRWNLAEHEMGHRSFFMHIIQYWYSPVYIRQILKRH